MFRTFDYVYFTMFVIYDNRFFDLICSFVIMLIYTVILILGLEHTTDDRMEIRL